MLVITNNQDFKHSFKKEHTIWRGGFKISKPREKHKTERILRIHTGPQKIHRPLNIKGRIKN